METIEQVEQAIAEARLAARAHLEQLQGLSTVCAEQRKRIQADADAEGEAIQIVQDLAESIGLSCPSRD